MTHRYTLVAILLAAIGAATAAWASATSLSPDIAVTLDGVDLADESIAVDDGLGTTPAHHPRHAARERGGHRLPPARQRDQLFALDTSARRV